MPKKANHRHSHKKSDSSRRKSRQHTEKRVSDQRKRDERSQRRNNAREEIEISDLFDNLFGRNKKRKSKRKL